MYTDRMNDKPFSELLIQMREARGLDAYVAAAKCGVSKSMWCHFEHGRRLPAAHQLYCMAKLFNRSMQSLYEAAYPSDADIARMRVRQ